MPTDQPDPKFTVYLAACRGMSLAERRASIDTVEAAQLQLAADIEKMIAAEGKPFKLTPLPPAERAYVQLVCDEDFAEKLKSLPAVGDVYPVVYLTADPPGISMEALAHMIKEKKNDGNKRKP